MSIIVEHEKRKREILTKSLDVFVAEGYEDTTYQKIADRCDITRTILYKYFRNKHDIFLCSIKQLTQSLESSIQFIIDDSSLSSLEKLKKTTSILVDSCTENRKLFTVILNYLLHLQKTGKDVASRVRRRIVRLRHLLSTILIEGKKNGSFLKTINVKNVNEAIYGLIESAIFRLAILNQNKVEEVRATLNLVAESLLVKN